MGEESHPDGVCDWRPYPFVPKYLLHWDPRSTHRPLPFSLVAGVPWVEGGQLVPSLRPSEPPWTRGEGRGLKFRLSRGGGPSGGTTGQVWGVGVPSRNTSIPRGPPPHFSVYYPGPDLTGKEPGRPWHPDPVGTPERPRGRGRRHCPPLTHVRGPRPSRVRPSRPLCPDRETGEPGWERYRGYGRTGTRRG